MSRAGSATPCAETEAHEAAGLFPTGLLAVLALTAITACATGTAPAGRDGRQSTAQALLPGIVLDGARSVGLARLANGTLGAFDLEDGRLLWEGDRRFEPLLVIGSRLAVREDDPASPNRFRIAWLDPRSGKPSGPASNWIELPGWVGVSAQRGRSFITTAAVSDGKLRVDWQARRWYAGGARPTPDIVERERRLSRGAVLVEPNSGSVEPLSQAIDVAGKAAVTNDKANGQAFGIAPWTVGDSEFRVLVDEADQRHEIHLERRTLAAPHLEERWALGSHNDQVVISPDRRALVVFDPGRGNEPRCSLWRTDEPGKLLQIACDSAPISGNWLGGNAYFLARGNDDGKRTVVLRAISLANRGIVFERQLVSLPALPLQR